MKITFGIMAHVDAGKTTVSEQILYRERIIKEPGRVDLKNTYMDYDEIERTRGITIFSDSVSYVRGENMYNMIDTPGHTDFSAEMERVLAILDYAILIINGSDGIQSHTETIWNLLEKYRIPTFIFINKLDITSASYERALDELQSHFSNRILNFRDCILEEGLEAIVGDDVIENLSETEENLIDKWFEGKIYYEDVRPAMISQIKTRKLFPCFGGAALAGDGIEKLLHFFYQMTETSYKNDSAFGGRIFKIRYDNHQERMTFLKVTGGILRVKDSFSDRNKINQIRVYKGERYTAVQEAFAGDVVAVTGLTSIKAGQGLGDLSDADVPVLTPALQARVLYPLEIPDRTVLQIFRILEEEDPSLKIAWDETLKQLRINIMGKIQLEVLQQVILNRFQISVSFEKPEVVYMETISKPVIGYGHFEPLRHYAEVVFRMEPLSRGAGIQFESQCHVDQLNVNFQNLIRTHVFETEHKGVLTGSKLTDIKIILVNGISHIKHTEGGDFREAVYRAIRQGLMKADSVLLEPYYRFQISVSESLAGRVLSDITRYFGQFDVPIPDKNGNMLIEGTVPVESFMNYGEQLMIMTGGRGRISLSFSHYDICHNENEVLKQYQYNPDKDITNPSCSVFCHKGTSFVVNWNEAEAYMHTFR